MQCTCFFVQRSSAWKSRYMAIKLYQKRYAVLGSEDRTFPPAQCGSQERLADRFLIKLPQAEHQQQNVENGQGREHRSRRQVRKLWYQRGSQSFTRIDQRVDQNDLLQHRKILERAPGIIGTAKEDHRR